ncbi:MAG: sigma-54 interaction domain-containing protein [Candidatus Binatia bacterium]
MEEKQSWVTCFFADVLLTYVEETLGKRNAIDYPSLFRGIEGFETPSDPASFLRDTNNWVPMKVLRELHSQCEKVSRRKDIAYHAARDFFAPGKNQLPSLFEIIVRVLNDVRSVLICANLWGGVQTSYLRLQSFDKEGARPEFYILAQFDENARPPVGSINLLRGMFEGFPRLYPFVEDAQCVEEISQLQIGDVIQDFSDFAIHSEGDRLSIRHRRSQQPTVEAIRVPLKSEAITLSREFLINMPDAVIMAPKEGRIHVLTNLQETDLQRTRHSPWAYKIVTPGTVSDEAVSYSFEKDQVYNAPYCRFRLVWKESRQQDREVSIENVRREVSQLLFDHLKQIKQGQTRMIQFNIEKRRLTLENIRLRKEIEREYSFAGIIGESQRMQDLFSLVRSAAETDVTVIIQGETGTGKELIAKAIHYNSPRRAEKFVAINCGALSETLLESELFGHEKGAFTGAITQRKGIFEVADGGTLFLDEISETTPSTQVKLLRVLQEGEFQRVGSTDSVKVDVRIIAATNQNLEELVKNGRFRQDLYYRLKVFPLTVLPLRDRVEDIPLLVSHFIEKRKATMNKQVSGITPQAMALLMACSWPGNVRELENTIQRMMVVSKAEILDVPDLPAEIRGQVSEAKPQPKDLKGIARESAEMIEKRAILDALSKTASNVTRAARVLGISRATLQNKMKAYGLRNAKE